MTRTTPFEIVLAEDHLADIALVREALAEHKLVYRLHVLRDGDEATKYINALDADPKAREIDLVLLDMHLPKRDGEEVLQCLRSTERYALTPVLVMTSSPSDIIEQKAIRHAALAFFQKPSTLSGFMELGAIVRRLLDERQNSRKEGRADINFSGGAS